MKCWLHSRWPGLPWLKSNPNMGRKQHYESWKVESAEQWFGHWMLLVLHGLQRKSTCVPGMHGKDLAIYGVSSSAVDICLSQTCSLHDALLFGVWNTWFWASEAAGCCLLVWLSSQSIDAQNTAKSIQTTLESQEPLCKFSTLAHLGSAVTVGFSQGPVAPVASHHGGRGDRGRRGATTASKEERPGGVGAAGPGRWQRWDPRRKMRFGEFSRSTMDDV